MNIDQVAVNSVSTRGAKLPETLAAYAEAGFRNVEFCLPQVKEFLAAGATIADVRNLLERHRLRCIGGFEEAVQAFSPPHEQEANHRRIADNARLIAVLGGRIMVVGTDGPPPDAPLPRNVLDVLARTFAHLAEQVQPVGVHLCLEFNWSPVVKSLRTAVEVARRSGAPNVGVLFDPAHYHCTPTKFDQINEGAVRYIKHVHVNDMRDKPGELSDCNADRVLPGQGILDLHGLIAQLERHGYSGYFAIEMFSAELWNMPVQRAARLLHESMLTLTTRGRRELAPHR